MKPQKAGKPRHTSWLALSAVLLLFAFLSLVGITWGLPSRKIDKYLFGDGEVWPGEKIYRLAKAGDKFSPTRGADVDVDPIRKGGDEPIPLTSTEEDVARIYLRYRLYTYQPDEMITMMALAGMRPGKLDLDPRLYQYGGLFIYPVGAIIKLCGMLGVIDVRSDVVYYLDNPDEFGKFYIVARAYSTAWGLVGVFIVYAITRRIASHRAGLLAALLFTLMPVVVCMAHEGKPHLPGAVLMLLAVYFAMHFVRSKTGEIENKKTEAETGNRQSTIDNRQFFWMCVCCGAALGMVLSSWPVFVLIPLRAAGVSLRDRAIRMLSGTAVAIGVYFITNPYIVINAFVNREVLRSNFANSLAMYEITRIGEGFLRVLQLTIEGATLPVLVVGLLALVVVVIRKNNTTVPLIVVATVFFVQFVLIGADKPAEYGRFGIFTNTALAVGAACILGCHKPMMLRFFSWAGGALVISWIGWCGYAYLHGFASDAMGNGTRMNLARLCGFLSRESSTQRITTPLATFAEPAPYCFPPIDFAHADLRLVSASSYLSLGVDQSAFAFAPVEDAKFMFPKYAEVRAFAPIFRTSRFVPDPTLSSNLLGIDPAWRSIPTRLDAFAWRARLASRETAISWANKPFFDSVLHYLTTRQSVPLRR